MKILRQAKFDTRKRIEENQKPEAGQTLLIIWTKYKSQVFEKLNHYKG